MNKRKEVVPNNLKQYRKQAGFTQREVAHLLGFGSPDRICHWEKGVSVPGLINLLKLSYVYRTTPIHLYSDLLNQIDNEINQKTQQTIVS